MKQLSGLKGVFVLVKELDPDANQIGLTKEIIQQDVELKLRMAGMNVLTQRERYSEPGKPFLYINLDIINIADSFVYNILVELLQKVRLVRMPDLVHTGTTWSKGSKGHVRLNGMPEQVIRNRIKDLVDLFLNDYLSVNPKK